MPKLIANERFFYAGRNVEKDEQFEAEQQDVALLTDANTPKARLAGAKTEKPPSRPQEAAKPQEAAPKEETPTTEVEPMSMPNLLRRYNRRDMRAKE